MNKQIWIHENIRKLLSELVDERNKESINTQTMQSVANDLILKAHKRECRK